jgi:hypothetical protein
LLLTPVLVALSALPVGCGPAAAIHLIQPALPSWQQHLNLKAETAYWSTDGKCDRVVSDFPPPGASTGRSLVTLYLRLPAGAAEPAVAAKSGPCVKGFFIQARGQYAGLSAVVGGRMKVAGRSNDASATRELEFELKCEDGSLLVGTIRARRDDWALHEFETKRQPMDVALLAREPKPAAATQKGP